MRQLVFIAFFSLMTVTVTGGADDPVSRLNRARSLRCTFTSSVETWVRSGHRVIEQHHDKGIAVYDNIDVAKGTARIISNGGAVDIVVWRDQQKSLWMLERTRSGNDVVTTVFPMYAEGTDEFVVLEARHWIAITGTIVVGQDSFGTCKVLE